MDSQSWKVLVFDCVQECEPECDLYGEGADLDRVCVTLKKKGCNDRTVFTAAFAYLVSVFTGQEDVLFTVSSDVPIRMSVGKKLAIDELLKQTEEILEKADRPQDAAETSDIGSARIEVSCASDDEYSISLDYRSSRYSKEWATSFAETYLMIVEGLISKTTVGQIALVADKQLDLMKEFNKTETPREDIDVVSMFRRCAKDAPEAIAVVADDRRYTYADADRITDALAGYLRDRGIGKGSVVSVLIPRNEYMPLVAFGVLKSGAAYQPLDPSYPEARLSFMTEDSGAALLIVDRGLRDKLGSWQKDVLFTDEIPNLPEAEPFDADIKKDDLLVLLYTSGTTGTPKGTMIMHGNVSELAQWEHGYFQMDSSTRCSAYASFGFDAHMWELYPTLTCGGGLYIVSDDIRLDLGAIAEFFDANGITLSVMTTQVGRQFALAYEGGTLKDLMVGGEALVPIDPKDVKFTMHNGYGPSECTVLSTSQTVDKLYHRIPIGKAIDNVKLYVVDDDLNRLPFFAPGELLISGPRVAKGYLNLPEKTDSCFLENPFTDEEGYERIYRTGDIVRMLADGRLDFIGRSDGQVKVRGFRIELPEVEAVIREYPGITDATVQAFADEKTGMKYLAAYIVSADKVDVSAMNDFIRQRKPPYLVPSVTMQIDAIPLTVNHKVDKRALPLPKREEADHEKPATKEEQLAFDCAAEALGHSDFGVLTDLEDAGLSSIGAMQLNVLLSKAFHKTLRLSEVRALHTVRDIASFFASSEKDSEYSVQKSYPLSSVQQGIYVECLARPGSTSYNLPLLLKLDPSVDPNRLKSALIAVIDAHPYLKARLNSKKNGEIEAVRDDDAVIDIPVKNMKDLENGFSELVYPFKLTQEPLTRASIILDDKSSYLFLDIHHLIFDGESVLIFMRDLEAAYAGSVLQKEEFTGFEASLDEQQRMRSTAYEKARAYYESLLDGADTDCLPVRDCNIATEEAGSISIDIKTDLGRLESFLHEGKITANALWNASFGLTLAKFLGRNDCVYATVYNGRNDSRLMDSVGMFVHTLPVVCKFTPGETGRDFISKIGRQLNDSMSNDLYPFAEICKNFDVRSDILFVYEGKIGTGYTVGGKTAEEIRLRQTDNLKAALTFYVYDTDDGFRLECEYELRHYEEWDILSMLRSMEASMKSLMENEAVDSISLLSGEDREKLEAFNDTECEIEITDIASLFSRTAAKYPDNTAVIFGDRHLSYRELDEMSDKIAAYVKGLGMGAEDVVSILIPRSEYMVVTALGALKAGSAYQPLDPGYPPERLQYMVKDAKAKLLIADESLTGLLPDYNGNVLLLKDIETLPKEKYTVTGIYPDDLFILLYTSGTTGQPKGVMLTHKNLVNFCDWYRKYYDLVPGSVVAAYASFGFDADMMDLYPALTTGAAVCIVPEEMRLDLALLDRYYEDNKVTHAFMTTQMGRMYATSIDDIKLKHLSVGGEKLVPVNAPEGYTLTNGYGPTECTIFTTAQPVDRLYDRVPIGLPLSNYKLYVTDDHGNELPVGATGELWVAGYGVSRGYLNQPEKTKAAFITNPFCDKPGFERVFRTGDIVRRLSDGRIDYIGRNDGQVKIRGFRVEVAEVEGVIREFPGITDVTVQAFDDESFGGKYIAAYVVSAASVDFAALEQFIKGKKPAYMVPAAFMQLDSIPLNQNQKVNKRALPKPERREASRDYEEPATPLEREICEEYATILGLEKVGATDSFFEIGGSSISAAQIVMFAMNKGYNIVYKDVFNNPSPRELARAIAGLGKEGKADAAADYDYTDINRLIAFNSMEHIDEISENPIGNVILAGATGFLGIHVLWSFIKNCDGKITCFLRRGTYESVKRRLIAMLMYYFGENTESLFDKRIFCVDGDITDTESIKALEGSDATTVINCAACVKHFAEDDILDRINVGGVENLVDFCVRTGKRLVHISTLSVAGEMNSLELAVMKEDMLYFGQNVENDYVRTKFMADRVILEARVKRGLDAVILRAGNLMGRNSDGEFQINFETNAFMRSLWAYIQLGQCPYSTLEQPVEFSPIDSVADAVITLAGANSRFSVFHMNNNHTVAMADVLDAIRRHGFDVKAVSDEEFGNTLSEASKHEEESRTVLSLVAYANKEGDDLRMVESDNRFTTNALYRLGFKWPIVDDAYLEKQLWSLDTLDFFDK